MTIANTETMRKACSKAFKAMIKDEDMTADTVAAGFLVHRGPEANATEKFQVFVKVCRYSDDLLKANRESGGLLCGMP